MDPKLSVKTSLAPQKEENLGKKLAEVPEELKEKKEKAKNKGFLGRYNLSVEIDWPGVKNLVSDKTVNQKAQDIVGPEFFRGSKEHYEGLLDSVLGLEDVDLRALSEREQDYILARLAELGNEAYDPNRAENITSSKPISLESFLNNLRNRRQFQRRFEKFMEDNREAILDNSGVLPDELKSSFIEEMSKDENVKKSAIEDSLEFAAGNMHKFIEDFSEKNLKLGVCRDIHLFVAQVAEDMGRKKAGMLTVSSKGRGHAIATYLDSKGNILFNDYGNVLKTNTKDMRLAIAQAEMDQKGVALRYILEYMDGTRWVFESKSGKQLMNILRDPDDNPFVEKDPTISVKVENNIATLRLDEKLLKGSTIVALSFFRNEHLPAYSNAQGKAFKVGQKWARKYMAGGVNQAVVNFDMKNLKFNKEQRVNMTKYLLHTFLAGRYNYKITPKLVSEMTLKFDAALDYSIDHNDTDYSDSISQVSSITGDFRFNKRFIFTGSDNKVYVDFGTKGAIIPERIQEASINPASLTVIAQEVTSKLGLKTNLGKISGREVQLITNTNAGIADPNLDHTRFATTKFGANAELQAGPFTAQIGAQQVVSDLEANHIKPTASLGFLHPWGCKLEAYYIGSLGTESAADSRLNLHQLGAKLMCFQRNTTNIVEK